MKKENKIQNQFSASQYFFNIGNYDRAIEISLTILKKTKHFESLVILGLCFLKKQKFEEANHYFSSALTINKKNPEILALRAICLKNLQQFDLSLEDLNLAIELNPVEPRYYFNRANLKYEHFFYQHAIEDYSKAISFDINNSIFFVNRGNSYLALEDFESALRDFNKSILLSPENSLSYYNRGRLFLKINNLNEALFDFNKSIELDDNNVDALTNRSIVLKELGQFEAAKECYEKALFKKPNDPNILWNLSLLELSARDYVNGWEKYHTRWSIPSFIDNCGIEEKSIISYFPQKLDKINLKGKNILIVAEQGIGDVIMFSSLFDDLLKDSDRITFLSFPRLVDLFSNSFPLITILNINDFDINSINQFDIILPIGSLGCIYRNEVSKFKRVPYIYPTKAALNFAEKKINRKSGEIIIGLSWKGGTKISGFLKRSLKLDHFIDIFKRYNVRFVSTQHGNIEEELREFNQKHNMNIEYTNFQDFDNINLLAGLISLTDFVITAQNTNVHLCGSMGKKCFAILPLVAEWRYGIEGDSMDWYESVEVIRQKKLNDWSSTITQLNDHIRNLVKW